MRKQTRIYVVAISLFAGMLLAAFLLTSSREVPMSGSGSISLPSSTPDEVTTNGDQSPAISDRGPASVDNDDELLVAAMAKLKSGNMAYNTPEKMKTGQTAHVTARIGSNEVSDASLKSGMSADPNTKTETAATSVSTKMKMELKSADFDITALSSEEQFVAGDTPTTWEWDIAPKHSGKLRLHLAAVVELNKLSRDFTTVDRDIAVQVDPVNAVTTFAKANGVWMLTTLGAAFAGGWAWIKRRQKPEQAKPETWERP